MKQRPRYGFGNEGTTSPIRGEGENLAEHSTGVANVYARKENKLNVLFIISLVNL